MSKQTLDPLKNTYEQILDPLKETYKQSNSGFKKIIRISNKKKITTDSKINRVFFINKVIFLIYKNRSFECLKTATLFNENLSRNPVFFKYKINHIETINESINETVNESINETINESINKPINELINENKEDYLLFTNEGKFIYNFKKNIIVSFEIKEAKNSNKEILIKENSLILKIKNKIRQYLKFSDLILKTFEYKNYYILYTENTIRIFYFKKYLKPLKIFYTKLLNIYFTDFTIILECKSTEFYYLTLFLKRKLKVVSSKYFEKENSLNETIMQTGIRFMHQNLIFKIFKTNLEIKEIIYKLNESPSKEEKEKLRNLKVNVNSFNRIYKKNEVNFKRKFKRHFSLINSEEILILKRLKIIEKISLNFYTKKLIDFDYEKDKYLFFLEIDSKIYLFYKTPFIFITEELTNFYKKICDLKSIVFTKLIKCALKGNTICVSISNELLIFKIKDSSLFLICNFVELERIENIERIEKGFFISLKNRNLLNDFILSDTSLTKKYFNFSINYEAVKKYRNIFIIYSRGVLYFLKTRIFKTKKVGPVVFMEIKRNKLFLVDEVGEVIVYPLSF